MKNWTVEDPRTLIATLNTDNERLRNALRFYASSSNWEYKLNTMDAFMHGCDGTAPILRDGGNIARQALEGKTP